MHACKYFCINLSIIRCTVTDKFGKTEAYIVVAVWIRNIRTMKMRGDIKISKTVISCKRKRKRS